MAAEIALPLAIPLEPIVSLLVVVTSFTLKYTSFSSNISILSSSLAIPIKINSWSPFNFTVLLPFFPFKYSEVLVFFTNPAEVINMIYSLSDFVSEKSNAAKGVELNVQILTTLKPLLKFYDST